MAKSISPKWEQKGPWVEDWFDDFLGRLIESPARHDWPDLGSQFWKDLQGTFVRSGIHEREAEESRRRIAANPPAHRDHVISSLLAEVRAQWTERDRADSDIDVTTREGALRASQDCVFCRAEGLASLYRHGSASPDRPATVVFYCICSLGEWTERNHKARNAEVARRIPSARDHRELFEDERYLLPPGVEIATPESFARAKANAQRLASTLADGAKKTGYRRIDMPVSDTMDESTFLASLGELESRYWRTLSEARRADTLYRARHGRAQSELDNLGHLALLGARTAKGDLSEPESPAPPPHADAMPPAAPMNLNDVEAL